VKSKTVKEVLEEHVAENATEIGAFRNAWRELTSYHIVAYCGVKGCGARATHMHFWVKPYKQVALYCEECRDEFCIPILEKQTAETAVGTAVCRWVDQDDYWQTDCGELWTLIADGPTENGMNYCPKCGRPLVVETAVSEEVDNALQRMRHAHDRARPQRDH